MRNFYVARFLLPASFGTWSLVNTLLYYANYADIGLNAGLILEAPKLIGQQRPQDARRVERQVYTSTLLMCGSIALAIALLSFLPIRPFGFSVGQFRIVAAAVVTLALLNYYNVIARIRDHFGLISVTVVLTAIVATVGVILANVITKNLGVSQVASMTVLGSAAAALTFGAFVRSAPAWPPDWVLLKRLIVIGLPVSLLPILFTLFLSLDRWIVAAMVPAVNMGYYGFGATLGMFLYMMPSTLAIVLFTRQIEHYGLTNDPKALEPLVFPPVQLSGYVMAFTAGAVSLALPIFIRYVLPSYTPGIRAAIYQVIGNCLLFAVPVSANFLISTGRKQGLFAALIAAGAGKCGLVVLALLAGRNIGNASLAVLAGDALYAVIVVSLAFRGLGFAVPKNVRSVAVCLLPFGICLPVSLVLARFFHYSGVLGSDLIRWAILGAVYVLVCGAFCLAMARRQGLLRQPFVARHLDRWLPNPLAVIIIGGERRTHD